MAVLCLGPGALGAGETNTWLGKTPDWGDGANWSAGTPPSGDGAQDALIRAVKGDIYPVLAGDSAVGGSLTIGERAQLSLNGHDLEVGAAIAGSLEMQCPGGSAVQSAGLTVEKGARLNCTEGSPKITVHAGGLANYGTVKGKPVLRIVGRTRGFRVNGGEALELSELVLGFSPFPYAVVLGGNVSVHGDLRLAGGRLIVKPSLDSQQTRFTVKGDLVFVGKEPCVMLVTEADLLLYGTIRSEGSAFCVDMPGEEKVWSKTDEAAYCKTAENAGWVRMVGEGDQAITPGGILPALRIAKPSGKVTVRGDLHCNGLYVARGNTLDLSKGQKLVLGHHLREWARNPEPTGVPTYGPCRTSRDLTNEGTIIGARAVPMEFWLNVRGTCYVVECSYLLPEPAAGAPAASATGQMAGAMSWAAPGSLAINRYGSRLQLKDGKLLLDGKPCETATKHKAPADQEELDAALDDTEPQEGDRGPATAKAIVTRVNFRTVAREFKAPEATPVNVAPLVERIVTPARASTVFAGNGPFWDYRDTYGAVDGDTAVGTGGAPFYEFVFPEPVTVGAVRLHSGTQICDGCQFVVLGDFSGRGVCDKVLAWARDGLAPSEQWWTAWGTSWAVFAPQKVWRLRLRVLTADGAECRPVLSEFEVFADKDSAERLAKRPDAPVHEAFPGQARFLEYGEKVEVKWPETKPEHRVWRVASIAFWMAGVAWGATMDESVHEKLPQLRDYAPCARLLSEVKDRYQFDAVVIFFEGEATGFPWPTINFRSALNASYLKKREVALAMRAASKPKKTGDELADAEEEAKREKDELEAGAPPVQDAADAKYSEELKIEDLPCQRNLLREFCDAAHEKGLEVYMICRPEDMGKLYIGPKDQDPYETFLKESAAGGVDGVSLTPDEEYPLWQCGFYPRWREFDERTRDKRKDFTTAELRRWREERSRVAGLCMRDRMENVRKIKPDCKFYVDGAHLLNSGDPYDVIWHIADPDYVGCSYQSHVVPRWAATSRNRRVAMGEYTHRTVRYNLESLLLGARMIRSYRFNYIELAKSQDHRIRENQFIGQFMRWGGTRPTRPPTALLVSRTSETYWPEDCRAGRLKSQDPDRCWMIEEIVYEFLIKNGYTFDVYYLDQADDLEALRGYRLVILPFAYSVSRAAFARLLEAYKAGVNFLICERTGDVDEIGQPYDRPLLEEWMAEGRQAGRIASADVNLVELESSRSFVQKMASIVDPLLGKHKDLYLKRYGNRIEAVVATVSPTERYVSFINWEDKESAIEAGLNLPDGQYKLLTLTSADPTQMREGAIAGEKIVSAEKLRNFALKLTADEVLSIYVLPADRRWGQW